MNSETPVLKWAAAAVGVIILFFCVGYFVVGRLSLGGGASGNSVAVATPLVQETTPLVAVGASASPGGTLDIDEKTDEIAAKQKADDAAKLKAAAEAKKKADDLAAAKAQEDAAAAAAAAAAAKASAATPTPGADAGTEKTADNSATASPAPPAGEGDSGSAPTIATVAATTPKPPADVPTPADTIYRVRVGSYATRDSARTMATELNGRGYAAIVVPGKAGAFRLQVGAYKDKKTADNIQQELTANGYDATVSN